jgi:hypothetical protein
VIGEIRELMIQLAGTASKERLSRREEEAAAAAQKQQQEDGADEQLQSFVWDPGGFPQLRWETHEKELMILQLRSMMQEHLSHQPASQPATSSACIQLLKRGAASFKNLNQCN